MVYFLLQQLVIYFVGWPTLGWRMVMEQERMCDCVILCAERSYIDNRTNDSIQTGGLVIES
jgi:hypothetical protein